MANYISSHSGVEIDSAVDQVVTNKAFLSEMEGVTPPQNTSAQTLITKQFVTAALQNFLKTTIYPIGYILTTIDQNYDPNIAISGTTWVRFAEGKTIVGVDTADTDFNTSEKTGGTKSVTLTSSQSGLPAHNHTATQAAHSHKLYKSVESGGSQREIRSVEKRKGGWVLNLISSVQPAVTVDNAPAQNAASAHTNLQPYVTVFFWKRTA